MSVCISAVSAGISEVLIKYTGNVWLHYILNNSLATVSAVEFNTSSCLCQNITIT